MDKIFIIAGIFIIVIVTVGLIASRINLDRDDNQSDYDD